MWCALARRSSIASVVPCTLAVIRRRAYGSNAPLTLSRYSGTDSLVVPTYICRLGPRQAVLVRRRAVGLDFPNRFGDVVHVAAPGQQHVLRHADGRAQTSRLPFSSWKLSR